MNALFQDRFDAALQLSGKLAKYKNKNGIVLAVPRGGVPIGYIIAKELGLPLEVVLSKKIGHPHNPEYAIGSVSLHGALIDDSVLDVDEAYIHREAERILKELKRKFGLFMGDRTPTPLKNKTVIVVDDGVATGSTIKATIHSIRREQPKEIVIAVPVAPPRTATELKMISDDFVCLSTPDEFYGVGQFYEDFTQVSDEEAIQLLNDANEKRKVA